MAISLLLSRRDVKIEAITVTNGLAHRPGRSAEYTPRYSPRRAAMIFPSTWAAPNRSTPLRSSLPLGARSPTKCPGSHCRAPREPRIRRRRGFPCSPILLTARIPSVRVLALGPLTNLAEALDHVPPGGRTAIEMVIMGGALRVPGNLGDGGAFKTNNTSAEWNLFGGSGCRREDIIARRRAARHFGDKHSPGAARRNRQGPHRHSISKKDPRRTYAPRASRRPNP